MSKYDKDRKALGLPTVNVTSGSSNNSSKYSTERQKILSGANQTESDTSVNPKALTPPTPTKTPIDQRVDLGLGAESYGNYIGMNIIPAYKEDSTLAKVGKGVVNYGVGGALSLIGNIFGSPQQTLMQADRASINAITGKPQDFSQMSFGKDILGTKEDNLLTTAIGTALDPATYVGGGIVDDLTRAGVMGAGAKAGTAENLAANAATGQRAIKGLIVKPQQATEEYLKTENQMRKLEKNAARNSSRGTDTTLYGTSGGTVSDSIDAIRTPPKQTLMLPEGKPDTNQNTGQFMIDLGRRSVGLPVYHEAKGMREIPTRVAPGELAKGAAQKEAAKPHFTVSTEAGLQSADTRAFKDMAGKTIAQSLQGDEVYDDILKNLEGANYISDDSVKAIAQGIKDKSGITYNLKDVYRNFRGAFDRAYPFIKQKYLDTFDASKKAYVDTIKKYTDDIYQKVVKGLGIKKDSKESAAVQWYGEGQRMSGTRNEIDPQTGKKITVPNMVQYTLDDLKKEFPATWQNIVEADKTFRNAYNELIDAVNQTRKQIYPTNPEKLVPKREDYYRHFREMQDSFEGIKNMFATPSQIDPKLAGISEFTKPKSRWASFMQKRGMGAYKADAVGGFLNYIQPASYAIHIDPHVVKFRGLAKDIADATENSRNANGFIKYLNDFSNHLAGKTSKYDRLIQEDLPGGRTTMRVLTWLNNRVKANQVLLNARSAISQLANVPVGVARIKNPIAIGKGIGDTLAGIIGKGETGKLYGKSQFISERYSSSMINRFDQRMIDQPQKFAAWLLGAFDELGTKFVWNSAYNNAVAEGIKDPIKQADDLTRSVVAGRGIGEVPLIQQSKLFQIAAPFQLEVANLWHVMGDMVKEKDFAGIVALFLGNYLFNNVAEDLTGNRVTFDPIDAVKDALSEEDMNAWKMAGRLGGEVLSNVPLGQSAASMYPEYGFSLSGVEMPTRQELFGRNDPTRFGSGLLIAKGMQDPLSKLIPPLGGAQVKKTAEALTSLNAGGVFNGKKLKYPVENTLENTVKGTLFGKSAFNEAGDYYDKNRRDLGENQTLQVMKSSDPKGTYESIMKQRKVDTIKSKIKSVYVSTMSVEEKTKKIKELQNQLRNVLK
jgi:hypothetical protein